MSVLKKISVEQKVKWLAGIYGVVGSLWFVFADGLWSMINFLGGFLLVTINFIYLESLSRKIVERNPEGAKWVALLAMVRYPLIAVFLYAIVSWRNFVKFPFFLGLSAIVFGLMVMPFSGGGSSKDAS